MSLHSSRIVLTALLTVLSSCSPDKLTANQEQLPVNTAVAASRSAANDTLIQTVAHGIARAMADSVLRMQLFEDMRDSPFPYHTLHLTSYLSAPRGTHLAQVVASHSGITKEDLLRQLHGLPPLAFGVGSVLDRLSWTGSGEIVVAGTAVDPRQTVGRVAITGFTTAGRSTSRS